MKNIILFLLAVSLPWSSDIFGALKRYSGAAGAFQSGTAVTTNGVTVELISPAAGSVVSNTITLTANASSLAGAITRVEFYVDGQLVSTVTNKFESPRLYVY